MTRRLAAILAAAVTAHSRLIGADEGGTLQALKAITAEVIDPTIAALKVGWPMTTGNGFLVGGRALPRTHAVRVRFARLESGRF